MLVSELLHIIKEKVPEEFQNSTDILMQCKSPDGDIIFSPALQFRFIKLSKEVDKYRVVLSNPFRVTKLRGY